MPTEAAATVVRAVEVLGEASMVKDREVVEEEEKARLWRAASSERTAGREPEVEGADRGESVSVPTSWKERGMTFAS